MDVLVIIVLIVFFVLGLFKGVLAQLATLLGLFCAFVFAKPLSPLMAQLLSDILGSTLTLSTMVAPLITGVVIFFVVRLMGIFLEKMLINKMGVLKGVNIMGGGVLSLVKGVFIWIVIFFFIHLVPPTMIESWVPKLFESKSYQLSLKHNPLGSKDVIARFQTYRKTRKLEKQLNSPQLKTPNGAKKQDMQDVLMDYLLEQAMENPEKLMEMMRQNQTAPTPPDS